MAAIPTAPPPPPPPAPSGPAKVLQSSRGPPANRDHLGGLRPAANAQQRSPLADIHPQALQHAAANLRKTQHREPLFASEPEQLLGRQTQLPAGGHWPDHPEHAVLGVDRPGAPLHVQNPGPDQLHPLRDNGEYSHSLNAAFNTGIASRTPPKPGYGSSATSRWMPGVQAQQMYKTHSVNNNDSPPSDYFKSFSQTTYYPSPQPPSNYSYSSSYTTTTTNNGDKLEAPSYPPPPPPQNGSASNPSQYSSFYSTTTTNGFQQPQQQPQYQFQQQQQQRQQQQSPQPTAYFNQVYVNGNNSSFSHQQQQPQQSNGSSSNGANNGTYSASYIPNPQQYIHSYATQTPAADLEPTAPQTQSFQRKTPKEYSFVEQLRDSSLTDRQKQANKYQKSNLPERLPPQTVAHIYEQSTGDTQRELSQRRSNKPYQSQVNETVVDELIKDMEYKMNSGFNTTVHNTLGDICTKCQKEIQNDTPGVTALGKAYHVTCFSCDQCQKQLAGCSFYSVDGKNLCQVDYMNSLDKCDKCATPITQKILRAMGKAFHPECFACPTCTKSLDGTPFTVDQQGTPYCLECYHDRFSPRCAVCLKAIVPKQGETEVARIVAMDRSYHVECYKCEDCGMQLNSKIEGQGCYPLEAHLFCKNCNLKRLKAAN